MHAHRALLFMPPCVEEAAALLSSSLPVGLGRHPIIPPSGIIGLYTFLNICCLAHQRLVLVTEKRSIIVFVKQIRSGAKEESYFEI